MQRQREDERRKGFSSPPHPVIHIRSVIPPSLIFNRRTDIRATLASHSIRAENRRIRKDAQNPPPARALAGCQGMWGGPGCGVGGMQAFLSLFPNIPFCSRLNIFTCCCWNTQVHGQTEAQRAGMASRSWGDGPHYSLAWGQLSGTGHHVAVSLPSSIVFQAFISFCFFFLLPYSIFTLYCSVAIDFTSLFSGFCCSQCIW